MKASPSGLFPIRRRMRCLPALAVRSGIFCSVESSREHARSYLPSPVIYSYVSHFFSRFSPSPAPLPSCSYFSTQGAARVFEMQLMPALLLQLRVSGRGDREPPDQGPEEPSSPPPRPRPSPLPVGDDKTDAGPTTAPSAAGRRNKGGGPAEAGPERGGRERSEGRGLEDEEEGDGQGAEAAAGVVVMPTPSAEERERLRTRGMDWGVVGVWCCPRSCQESCEESVVVQLPV